MIGPLFHRAFLFLADFEFGKRFANQAGAAIGSGTVLASS
jgi:hypothetical protein